MNIRRWVRVAGGHAVAFAGTAILGTGLLMAQGATAPAQKNANPANQNPANQTQNPANQNPANQNQNQANQNQANQTQGQRAQNPADDNARRAAAGLQLSEKGNDKGDKGLEVTSVAEGSAAAQAGFRQNDRILSIDGRAFRNQRQVNAYLAGQSGRRVPVLVERGGQRMTIQYDLAPNAGDHAWLGVYLEEGETADNVKGARITQVFPAGPASRAGLQVGDNITRINDQKVDDSSDLVMYIQGQKPQTQDQFFITRNNQEMKIPVTLGSRNDSFPQNYQAGYRGGAEQGNQAGTQRWDDRGTAHSHDPYSNIPPYAMQLEQERRTSEQHERIENEIRALRDEIAKLREELKKK